MRTFPTLTQKMSRKHGRRKYAHVFDRAVVAVGFHLLDFVDDIHPGKDTSEHCIASVEVRCASFAHVDIALFGCEECRIVGGQAFSLFSEFVAKGIEACLVAVTAH